MFCTNCGAKLDSDIKFCTECGFEIKDETKDKLVSIDHEVIDTFENFENENENIEEMKKIESSDNSLKRIIKSKDELTNKIKNKFSYKKKDLIEAIKGGKSEANIAFNKAVIKTKESISKMLEDEIDRLEIKLEKLKLIFDQDLLQEDEYQLMREKTIQESLENKSLKSKFQDEMDSVASRLERLKSIFEKGLLNDKEYNSIRKQIIDI